MSLRSLTVVAVLVACAGPSPKPTKPWTVDRDTMDEGMAKLSVATNADSMKSLLADSVVNGGVWFADTSCRVKFASAGTIEKSDRDAFAACLATIRFAKSARSNPHPDIAVVTYAPGIELEVLFARNDDDDVKIKWIGFVSRREIKDAFPTVTQTALEAHYVEAPGELPTDARTRLDSESDKREKGKGSYAWVKLCIGVDGQITTATPRMATSVLARDVFVEHVKSWKLRPFELGGQPTPVCSLVYVEHPAGVNKARSLPPPLPDAYATAVVIAADGLKRIAGHKALFPSETDRRQMSMMGMKKLKAVFSYCIASDGKPTHVARLRSCGIPNYDKGLHDLIVGWRYEPFASEPGLVACSIAAFSYETR